MRYRSIENRGTAVHPSNSSFKSELASWFNKADSMTGDSKSSRFFGIDISSKGIDPTEVIPNSERNPAVFVRGSVSSSKVDDIVDDHNQVNTDMSVKDMKIIIDERPRRQQGPNAVVVPSCSSIFPGWDMI